MKRVYICCAVFVVIMVYSYFTERYVKRAVDETSHCLSAAMSERRNGDTAAAFEHADAAWHSWRELTKYSSYILADLTIASDVTVSLARVRVLAESGDDERFAEECIATVLLLEHFLADNRNFLDGLH